MEDAKYMEPLSSGYVVSLRDKAQDQDINNSQDLGEIQVEAGT